jgi:hypothetical protein
MDSVLQLAVWLRRCEASEHPAESEKDPATVSIVADLTQGMANAFKTEKELENSLAVFKVCSTMTHSRMSKRRNGMSDFRSTPNPILGKNSLERHDYVEEHERRRDPIHVGDGYPP